MKAMKARLRKSKEEEAPPAEGHAPAGGETPHDAPAGGETPHASQEAPASPEPEPEASEAALWPQAGVKIAVGVEHLLHSLRLGETGVSEGPAPDDALEVIVRLDSWAVLSSLRLPRSVLVPVRAPMRNMRLLGQVH